MKFNLLPKEKTDYPAVIFLNAAFISITLYEIFHVLPTVDETSKFGFAFHLIVGLFFFINIYGNYIMVIATDTSTKGIFLPTMLKDGWRFCYSCECNSPPRSWHCPHCNRCIMRRDHHCSFAGVCVGHRNYRYFITMLFYLSVCGIYINVLNAEFTYDILGGFNYKSVIAMLLPWVAWLVGVHGPFTFLVAFMSSMTLFGTLLSVVYFCYQLNIVTLGKTTYETSKGEAKIYQIGRLANLKQILGKNWKYCWLFPWITSHLYTDGTRFPTINDHEEIKDM